MRFLSQSNSSVTPPPPETVDSDFFVILAALLCALICVLGLIAVARCAWIRRFSAVLTGRSSPSPPTPNKGLKKKILRTLPKLTYDPNAVKFTDCAICLTEFVAGDELRVLPQCGHGFHVGCIDTWLGSHSSCPSCRRILVIKCEKCNGKLPEEITIGGSENEIGTCDPVNRFLP